MDERGPSRTALVVALMRSLHSRADPEPLFDDPWGERLVPPTVREAIAERVAPGAVGAERERRVDACLRASPSYANVILRTRCTEDALTAAAAAGIGQTVLIGAGFDSWALRRPTALQGVQAFEVDHPATQGLKRQRLAALGVEPSTTTHYLAADLGAEDLAAALGRSSYDFDRPAFFSWLGVTMYLTREANLATLGAIARCAAAGSELVLTYIDRRAFDAAGSGGTFASMQATVAAAGEPWITGFDPAGLALKWRALGYEGVEDLDGADLARRYAGSGANGIASTPHSRLAHLRLSRKASAGSTAAA
ncbi:MAG: class I SAM-dependent methyltransferase [Burkholderiales bacterium]|nr:class I SAM-dependent methyltransferase [Burkholderiales bacterium]